MKASEVKLFYSFLKKNRVLKDFSENLVKVGQTHTYISDLIYPSMALSSAFTWVSTPQGENFWRNLHFQWLNLLSAHHIDKFPWSLKSLNL